MQGTLIVTLQGWPLRAANRGAAVATNRGGGCPIPGQSFEKWTPGQNGSPNPQEPPLPNKGVGLENIVRAIHKSRGDLPLRSRWGTWQGIRLDPYPTDQGDPDSR